MSAGGGAVVTIFNQAMSSKWVAIVLLISAAANSSGTTACQTSASRMLFAFSRDRAVPAYPPWSAVNANRVPANGVIVTAVLAAIITLPALVAVDINGAPVPVAFFAVVSIGVVGLYLAFAVPIFLRWRAGDSFKVGSQPGRPLQVDGAYRPDRDRHHLDRRHVPDHSARRWDPSFEWKFVNYTPLLVGGVLILLYIYWHVSVNKWFTGPIKQIDLTETTPETA